MKNELHIYSTFVDMRRLQLTGDDAAIKWVSTSITTGNLS